MKFFRILLLFPVLLLSSCGDKYYVEEVMMNTKTISRTVYSNNWIKVDNFPGWDGVEDSGNTFFYYDLRIPELSDFVFNKGVMNAYLETYDGQVTVLTPLPFDNYYRYNYEWAGWTEQVTCEFSLQNVRFILKYNDFDVDRPPLDYTFMVRLAW